MKILIVDDQYNGKVRAIIATLSDLGLKDVELVPSSRSAIRALSKVKYDLLIVDLQIPEELGEDVHPRGGRQLLEYIEKNAVIHKPTSVIALTSHQEAYEDAKDFFAARGWTLLREDNCSAQLRSIFLTQMTHLGSGSVDYDVVIITALAHTELAAVRNLPCNWVQFEVPGRPEIFYKGTFRDKLGQLRTIAATSLPCMGMTSAAIVSSFACFYFRPKLLLMTGIAAGIKGKVNLGDILVVSPSWDWGSGKMTVSEGKAKFLSSPTQIPLDADLHSMFTAFAANREYLDEIYVGWKQTRPSHDLTLHVGPVATGAVVLEDPDTVELIRGQNRNTVGVEMEAFGVMSAAFYAGIRRPKAIVIKSVCDFADPLKNNDWQPYAAYTSAALSFRFLEKHFDFSDR